ncbi:MAG: hypothetical protein AAGA96_15040 [Verrucomicrobiota bacterium]
MDIEGYEYETLLSTPSRTLNRFRIIVVEFHQLGDLWCDSFFKIASRTFEKLLYTHSCVHIHPNNRQPLLSKNGLSIPPLAEFTFYRNDRFITRKPAREFPHCLDFDNTERPHYPLPKCWY